MTDMNDMYADDENDIPLKNKKQIPSTLGTFNLNGVKSSFIEIDGNKIEIVNKSYVDGLENDLRSSRREIRAAQVRINQLTRVVNMLSGEIRELKNQQKARGRFD